jgi:hypothetical protein
MNSIKCNQCGLTNWATAENCKRCQQTLLNNLDQSVVLPKIKTSQSIPNPSIFQIIKNDALSCVALILPVVMWGIYIAVTYFGFSFESKRTGTTVANSEGNPVFLIAPIVLSFLCGGIIFWRLSSIQKLFKSGERVIGRIIDISFFKDRGRIEYTYSYGRQNFQSGTAIMKNSKTQSYQNGQEILLVVNSANPNKALIQDLYT